MITEELVEKYRKAGKKLILLDYDGTLVDYASLPEDAVPSEKLLDSLLTLNTPPDTKVVIITGRSFADMENFMGDLPVDIIAEHGAIIRENGTWRQLLRDSGKWKAKVQPVLEHFIEDCPGAFVEEKDFSLAWHYRNMEQEAGMAASRALIGELEKTIGDLGLRVTDGKKVVEVKCGDIHKGKGTEYLTDKVHYDFILSIGDDKTDEDMFAALAGKPEAFTIKVGKGETLARYRLTSVREVIVLLNELL